MVWRVRIKTRDVKHILRQCIECLLAGLPTSSGGARESQLSLSRALLVSCFILAVRKTGDGFLLSDDLVLTQHDEIGFFHGCILAR